MSSAPRERHVFEMPRTATSADAGTPLPASWARWATLQSPSADGYATGFIEQHHTVSINAAHFAAKSEGALAKWNILARPRHLGRVRRLRIPGPACKCREQRSVRLRKPPRGWSIDFVATSDGPATLTLHLLPTFAVDSDHHLRYAVAFDSEPLDRTRPDAVCRATQIHRRGRRPQRLRLGGQRAPQLRARHHSASPALAPGPHTIRLYYRDPGVVFEHLVLTFPGAPPAYPVPPETK